MPRKAKTPPLPYTFNQARKRILERMAVFEKHVEVFSTDHHNDVPDDRIKPGVAGVKLGGFYWQGHTFMFTAYLEVREHVSPPWANQTLAAMMIESLLKEGIPKP